jgi:peptide alpha-N-acetyltransferase
MADPPTAITYEPYTSESQLPYVASLVETELSEPYVVYTYRYFLHQWSASLYLLLQDQAH